MDVPKKDDSHKDAQEQLKKPYAAPTLIVYGNVEEITAQVGTKGNDGLTGSRVG